VLQALGWQRQPGEKVETMTFSLSVTAREREQLGTPQFRWLFGETAGPLSSDFIESVEDDLTANQWFYREKVEYLVVIGFTFRLSYRPGYPFWVQLHSATPRGWTEVDNQGNNLPAHTLHSATPRGWTEVASINCDVPYEGVNPGRRQSYELLRQRAQMLVALGGKPGYEGGDTAGAVAWQDFDLGPAAFSP
jgi:hypothetical protein